MPNSMDNQCFTQAHRTAHTATRWLLFMAVVFFLLTVFGILAGCQNVGPNNKFDRDTATLENPSPVTLDIADNDKRGTASGVGPARYTHISESAVETFQTGTVPRDMWVKKAADGTVQFNLSSGSDVIAQDVKFDPATGAFSVGTFSTNASTPLKAHNAAYADLVAYFSNLTDAQKEARLAEVEALKVTAPELADLILGIVSGL